MEIPVFGHHSRRHTLPTQFLSAVSSDRGCRNFFSFVVDVNVGCIFGFLIYHVQLSVLPYADSVTRGIRSLQIPFLQWCVLLIEEISLVRSGISVFNLTDAGSKYSSSGKQACQILFTDKVLTNWRMGQF